MAEGFLAHLKAAYKEYFKIRDRQGRTAADDAANDIALVDPVAGSLFQAANQYVEDRGQRPGQVTIEIPEGLRQILFKSNGKVDKLVAGMLIIGLVAVVALLSTWLSMLDIFPRF